MLLPKNTETLSSRQIRKSARAPLFSSVVHTIPPPLRGVCRSDFLSRHVRPTIRIDHWAGHGATMNGWCRERHR